MLFAEKIKEIAGPLESEKDRLFELALQNQSHAGDLLLVAVNGSFNEEASHYIDSQGNPSNPYITGPNTSGLADSTHYDFIHEYRKVLYSGTSFDFSQLHEHFKGKREEIDKLLDAEYFSIHL